MIAALKWSNLTRRRTKLAMPQSIVETVYPESKFFGFTRCDGTTYFLTRVRSLLHPEDVVLDVGCGRGQRMNDPCVYRRDLQNLTSAAGKVIGMDVNPQAASNPFIHEFRLIEDVRRWPVPDSTIDLLYCDYVLEHVADPNAFFAEAHRVLKPGGYIGLRTPNWLSYGAMISWLIPNRFHAKVLGRIRPQCNSVDVFPTVYRCNTRRKLRRTLQGKGFDAAVYTIEAEPGYLESFPLAYRIAAVAHRHLPSPVKSTLLAFARKPNTMDTSAAQ
jgi:ubiquinone/menaquinone biosynthesis C-methylase UbiE